MSDANKANFVATSNYDASADDAASTATMPTTGASKGLVLGDLAGLDYDDPKWDQLSIKDMNTLISKGGYGSPAISSVGKLRVSDVDGPASLNNNFTGVGSIGLPSAVSVAATFNKELANAFGDAIGTMAHDMQVSGWYAPATNTHRYAYAGRNFEYFSEDPVLAGSQVAEEIKGAQAKGVYAFLKHFALNDQETNRTHMLATWTNEQALREILPALFRARRQGRRRTRDHERLQLHRPRVRGRKLGAAHQRPARRVGLPRHGPHRLLRGLRLPERRPDHP